MTWSVGGTQEGFLSNLLVLALGLAVGEAWARFNAQLSNEVQDYLMGTALLATISH